MKIKALIVTTIYIFMMPTNPFYGQTSAVDQKIKLPEMVLVESYNGNTKTQNTGCTLSPDFDPTILSSFWIGKYEITNGIRPPKITVNVTIQSAFST